MRAVLVRHVEKDYPVNHLRARDAAESLGSVCLGDHQDVVPRFTRGIRDGQHVLKHGG